MTTQKFKDRVALINEILDSYDLGSKEKTLAYQRGLLTGILARASLNDGDIKFELEQRLEEAKFIRKILTKT